MFHYIPLLSPLKVLAKGAEDYVMPLMVFIQLFTTFCKVNPREMRICRWHIVMISVQLACCLLDVASCFLFRPLDGSALHQQSEGSFYSLLGGVFNFITLARVSVAGQLKNSFMQPVIPGQMA